MKKSTITIIEFYLICFLLIFHPCCKKNPMSPDIAAIILPTIEHFTANPESIEFMSDSIVNLSWSVKNATTVMIDQGIGTVSTAGTIQINPEETTTYTLTATNNDGSKSQSCIVQVTASAFFELMDCFGGYTSYGCCSFIGIVKNVGNATGYNVMITFQALNADLVIIDTAHGFPADLGNIAAGMSATFEAIFFDVEDWSLIYQTPYEITWLNAQGMRISQTGIVPFK